MNTQQRKQFSLLLSINLIVHLAYVLFAPFLSAYYKRMGLSASEIGVLMVISPLASVFLQPIWGRRADRSGKAKKYASLVALGTAAVLPLFLVGRRFGDFIALNVLFYAFASAIDPMTDAIVIRNARQNNYPYSVIRAGGTFGYAIGALLTGLFVKTHYSAVFISGSAAYLLLLLMLQRLPQSENSLPRDTASKRRLSFGKLSEVFQDRKVIYVLALVFIFRIGYSFLTSFLGVYVLKIGYTEREIGILNFVSAGTEIPILFLIDKIQRRFKPISMIAFGAFMTGVRLILLSTGYLPAFVLSQMLQGVTYMFVYYECALYISGASRAGRESEAQSILYIIQAGVASILGSLLGGRLIDLIGISPAFRLIGCMQFILVIIVAVIIRKKKEV